MMDLLRGAMVVFLMCFSHAVHADEMLFMLMRLIPKMSMWFLLESALRVLLPHVCMKPL